MQFCKQMVVDRGNSWHNIDVELIKMLFLCKTIHESDSKAYFEIQFSLPGAL